MAIPQPRPPKLNCCCGVTILVYRLEDLGILKPQNRHLIRQVRSSL